MITMRRKLFSDMMLASRDGSLIEVRHGPNQEIALTRWSGQGQLLAPGPNRRVNPVGNGRVALCGNRSPGTGSNGRAGYAILSLMRQFWHHRSWMSKIRDGAGIKPEMQCTKANIWAVQPENAAVSSTCRITAKLIWY
jgi:hypothetical protein